MISNLEPTISAPATSSGVEAQTVSEQSGDAAVRLTSSAGDDGRDNHGPSNRDQATELPGSGVSSGSLTRMANHAPGLGPDLKTPGEVTRPTVSVPSTINHQHSLPPTVVPLGTILNADCGVRMAEFQPVADVAAHLETRRAVKFWQEEEALAIRLSGALRAEMKAMQSCAELVLTLVKAGLKVQPAVKEALAIFNQSGWQWHPTTFRAKYDLWVRQRDWLVFVNRSKAGADWQETNVGLPDEFLKFVASIIGKYKREDAQKEALCSIYRQWHAGKNLRGEREAVPGYGFAVDWFRRNFHGKTLPAQMPLPPGWSYSNVLRQMKARNVLPKAARKMLLQGTSAAKEFVPDVLGATTHLRFLEEIQFDDVKTDWRIFDPVTKQAMDLWLLIARDRATRTLLGFGMRPARAREDGTQEHLKLRDMKQLCGWVLERWGLPPYVVTWVIENGTATLSEAMVAALQEMVPFLKVRYGSMVGGVSPSGYFERRVGNSKSKASLESLNRSLHIIGAHLPGQTGPHYGKRPTDLAAREKECKEIASIAEFLPAELRDELGYGLLLVEEAREALREIFTLQNERDDHQMEGFIKMLETYDEARGLWVPRHLAPRGAQLRQRKETPLERAARSVRDTLAAGGQWKQVSPEIITAFYEHTQRRVKVSPCGEIEFRHEEKLLTFVSPGPSTVVPATKLLGHFHPDDPAFLHLTDGRGAIIGTWLLRDRAKNADEVSRAMAYQNAALKRARELADELAAPERERLETMRANNDAVVARANDFVEVAQITPGEVARPAIQSAVASGLNGVKRKRKEDARAKAERVEADAKLVKELGEAGAEAILTHHEEETPTEDFDAGAFLKTLGQSGQP